MAKKNDKKPAKPSVKVQDLEPEKDPKGGATFLKIDALNPALKIDNTVGGVTNLGNTAIKYNSGIK